MRLWIFAILLIAGQTFFAALVARQFNEFDEHAAYAKNIQLAGEHFEHLNVEILRLRYGFNSNYDAVVNDMKEIDELQRELERVPSATKRSAELVSKQRRYLDNVSALLEDLKTKNSSLNNSTRFLFNFGSELARRMEKGGERKLSSQLNELIRKVLLFNFPAGDIKVEDVLQAINELEQQSRLSDNAAELDTMLAHARTIVALHPTVNNDIHKLMTVPLRRLNDQLLLSYSADFYTGIGYARFFWLGLIPMTVMLLVPFLNMKKSRDKLQTLNSALLANSEELRQAQIAADSSNKAKSEFLANMSHELRTPLNGVLGTADLLINSDLGSRQLEYARMVRESAESLMEILNDILDLSKIEAGKLSLEIMPFNLQDVVEEVCELMAARASEKKLELIVRYAPDAPRCLFGDAARIRQVLANLVGNAVKFTSKGSIVVDVQCKTRSNGHASLVLRVVDTGIGIDQAQAAKLFQKFTQADSSTTRCFGGTGLGLAICKSLIEAMQGTIELSSAPGRGSVFTVSLTIREAPLNFGKNVIPHDGLKSLRFLIVDKHPTSRAVLSEKLEGWNLRCTSVSSTVEALQMLKAAAAQKEPYHVVLLDFEMPEMDGGMMAFKIKSDESISNTILILLATIAQSFSAEDIKSMKFAALLNKPVREAVLLDTLNKVWGEYSNPGLDGGSKAEKVPNTISPTRSLDCSELANMQVLLIEDNHINRAIAVGMMEKFGIHVDVAVNGKEGSSRAIKERFDVILMDCHMPVMDGFEATGIIRRFERESNTPRHVPIIAMTANVMKGDRNLCIASGMDDYLSKPVLMEQLQSLLLQYASSSATMPAVKQTQPLTEETPEPVWDTDFSLKMVCGDVALNKKIVNMFLDWSKDKVQEFQAVVDSGDLRQIEREAHSIHGTGANIGAMRISSCCRRIQLACRSDDLKLARALKSEFDVEFKYLLDAVKEYLKTTPG